MFAFVMFLLALICFLLAATAAHPRFGGPWWGVGIGWFGAALITFVLLLGAVPGLH